MEETKIHINSAKEANPKRLHFVFFQSCEILKKAMHGGMETVKKKKICICQDYGGNRDRVGGAQRIFRAGKLIILHDATTEHM